MADQNGERLRVAYEDRVRLLEQDVLARQRELKILSEVASKVHVEDEVQSILDIALEEILGRLGLHTAVQQIVLQHGGEIVAGRAPAGGAGFTISLPALPAEDPAEYQEAL